MSQETIKAALGKTIENIKKNPMFATVAFKADTEWKEDVLCSAKVRNFAPLLVDEPPELGGQDAGMNPVELLLVALGTCQEIVYSAYAAFLGIPLEGVTVKLRGTLDLRGLFAMDPSVPAGYKNIRFETQIRSAASAEQIRTLIETVESHCPVMDTLTRAVEVSGKAFLNGREILDRPDYGTTAQSAVA